MMFKTLFKSLKNKPVNDEIISRRNYERRDSDKCVSFIDGKIYPVENWSKGGVLVYADEKQFSLDKEKEILLKFKLRDDVMEVPHKGKVVRKSINKVAFQFAPLSNAIKRQLQTVIDDSVSAEFAESQWA